MSMSADIIAAYMRAVASAAGVLSLEQVQAYLREGAVYVSAGGKLLARLQDTLDEIERMVAEGRDPTPEEIETQKQRIIDASAEIQSGQD